MSASIIIEPEPGAKRGENTMPVVSRGAGLMIIALVLLSVGGAWYARASGRSLEVATLAPVTQSRNVSFQRLADGTVDVRDVAGGGQLQLATREQGYFLNAAVRAVSGVNIPAQSPVVIVMRVHGDGMVSMQFPSTGRQAVANAFGEAQVRKLRALVEGAPR